MNKNKIEFYFDFLSPYSYMAWTKVRSMNYDFDFYPISLPNIISFYETKGPGQIKPKRDYLARDLFRFKTLYNIPFRFPKTLPFNSLYALRLSLKMVSGARQKEMIDLFYQAAWVEGLDLGDSDIVEKILIENNFDAKSMMDQISTKEVKIALRLNIDKALSNGVFGVPTFIILDDNKELFWGNDSIKYLEMYLNNEDPMNRTEYNNFLTNYPM